MTYVEDKLILRNERTSSLHMRTPQKVFCEPGSDLLSDPRSASALILDFQPTELWDPKSLSYPHWTVLSVSIGGGHSEDVVTRWTVS